MINSIREQLDDREFLGVVEDIMDVKRTGKVRVRVAQLHGRYGVGTFIPTEHLPWATPDYDNTGGSFAIPDVGKVVAVSFIQGNIKRPVYSSAVHLNYNLQEKLLGMTDEQYAAFFAVSFDDQHQYFHSKEEGIMFDYVKSHFNIRPNGDMIHALRDNLSRLYLGSPDATEPMMLGNQFMNLFSKLINCLLTNSFIGNMGAPVMPSPMLMEICNEFLANSNKYLSDHIFITDNQRIKPQTRTFDRQIQGDLYNWYPPDIEVAGTSNAAPGKPSKTGTGRGNGTATDVANAPQGYVAQPRPAGAENPSNVHPTNYANNLSSAALPPNRTKLEATKLAKPAGQNVLNGLIPITKMAVSTYLQTSFPEGDERSYLLSDAASALDRWLDAYHKEKSASQPRVIVTKGYQNETRQGVVSGQYSNAPVVGTDPFGWGNQVELYWAVQKRDCALVDCLKYLLETGQYKGIPSTEEQTLKWLLDNSATYKWRNAGRDGNGDEQWWHWIYDATM